MALSSSPNAKYVMVKYFDYTCSSCRKVHEQLQFVEEKHPGLFCVILLPVPLNRACNPFIPNQSPKHQHACELARLSMAAWKANPGKWPEVHEQLISTPDLPPEVAEAAVGQIVGHDQLELAKEDSSVAEAFAIQAARAVRGIVTSDRADDDDGRGHRRQPPLVNLLLLDV